MTKSELRKARKVAVNSGLKLTGELAIRKNPVASARTKLRAAGRRRATERKQKSTE